MKNKDIIACGASLYRVLNVADDTIFVMDCLKPKMPYWISIAEADCKYVTDQELYERTGKTNVSLDDLDAVRRRVALNRYTIIAGVLPFLTDVNLRGEIIKRLANEHNLSAQTIRNYLYDYLIYQNTAVLAPKPKDKDKKLTPDQKNIRWALNKFFYTKNNNSLNTAYTLMLKHKYCDENGVLLDKFPTFAQFRYFYRQHRNMQTFYISRDGKKNYERNNRPLLGDGVQAFAPNIGVGLLDATICDLYLVDEGGNLVGRPILSACVDAYSGMCCGYNLSWEGGNYSLRGLMLNIIADKVEHCKKFGISINKTDWNCDKLLGTFISDRGSEYISENFEQIAELGVSLLNLPAFRPDLKGKVEKFFDLVQNSYKKHLKGKGVIQPDFGERGGRDYRKVFKEKGKEAFKNAINAMKIPETLDKLGKVFHSFAVSMNESVQNVQNARMELGGAKKHFINAGRLFFGKGAKEQEFVKHDKGVLSRLQNLFAKMSNGFSALENKSLNLADKLRYNRIKDSVKADLDFFNGKTTAKDAPTPVKDNIR